MHGRSLSQRERPPLDARAYEATARLLDGRPVLIRAIRPDDKDALREGFRRLSDRSVYFRFFYPKQELSPEDLTYLTEIDFDTHVALVAELDDGTGIGVGRFIGDASQKSAEVAFAVDDAHQGLGVGTLLLEHLVRIARAKKLEELRALVLPGNRSMIEVFQHSGLPTRRRLEGNLLEVTLSLTS